jgi:hypothetical protein
VGRAKSVYEQDMRSARVKHLAIAFALFRFYCRLIPQDWYRRPPFIPVPPPAYVEWRLKTAYGKHRPSWKIVIRDLWQFGNWLRTFDKN